MSSSKKSASKDVTVHESPWRGFDGDGEVIHQGQESLDFAFFAAARILDAPLPAGEPARSKMSALRDYLLANFVDQSPTASLRRQLVEAQVAAAVNMERSVAALGPALAEVEPHVSPQLARSMQSTENAWRDMETEFGMLSSWKSPKLPAPNRRTAVTLRTSARRANFWRSNGPADYAISGFKSTIVSTPSGRSCRNSLKLHRTRTTLKQIWPCGYVRPSGILTAPAPLISLTTLKRWWKRLSSPSTSNGEPSAA